MSSSNGRASQTPQATDVFFADTPSSSTSAAFTDRSRSTEHISTPRPPSVEGTYNKLYVDGNEECIERGFQLTGDHTCESATQWITVELCDGHGTLPIPQARNFMNLKENQQKKGTSGWKLIKRRERTIGAFVTVIFYRKAGFLEEWKIRWYAS